MKHTEGSPRIARIAAQRATPTPNTYLFLGRGGMIPPLTKQEDLFAQGVNLVFGAELELGYPSATHFAG